MCFSPVGAAASPTGRRSRLPKGVLVLLGAPLLLIVFGGALLWRKLREAPSVPS